MPNFAEAIEKFKVPLALCLLGLVLITGGIILSPKSQVVQSGKQEFPKESLQSNQKKTVDISGAVVNPGVYQLDSEARVEDVVKAAGGFSEKANAEYISKHLNLAAKVSDGIKIYIPFEGESTGGLISGFAGTVAGVKTSGLVNINSGTQAELEALPGIGPVTASKIISGRPYGKVENLLDQKIVSKAIFEKIKDSLTL